MRWRMMLREVVRVVCASFFPVNAELFLSGRITQPVITHVPGLWTLHSHGFSGKCFSCRIVSDQWGWWLRMSKFLQRYTDRDNILSIVKQSPSFCFSSWANNVSKCLELDLDWTIPGWWWNYGRRWRHVTQEIISRNAATSTWKNQISCVWADM